MYELYNTLTEEVEGHENLSSEEAESRNDALRRNREPQRWVPCRCSENDE